MRVCLTVSSLHLLNETDRTNHYQVHITLMTLRRLKGHGRPVISPHHIDDIEKVQRSWSASD